MSDGLNASRERLSRDSVEKFLRANPDFFIERPDLITEMDFPHHAGQAVSLIEKQVAILRERNIDMRQRLNSLLDNARDNDALFEKTKRLVLDLLEARSLEAAIEAVESSFRNDFEIHYTRIILFGSNGVSAGNARIESIHQARNEIGKRLQSGKAVSGGIDVKEIEYLFDDDASQVGSAAITVLSQSGAFGVLAVGNQDPTYYRSSMGTLFLGYIGEVLNRVLPKFL